MQQTKLKSYVYTNDLHRFNSKNKPLLNEDCVKNEQAVSHLFMDGLFGGKINIFKNIVGSDPKMIEELRQTFYDKLFADYKNGSYNSIIEVCTPTFNLFFDFDYKFNLKSDVKINIKTKDIIKHTKILQESIKMFFEKIQFTNKNWAKCVLCINNDNMFTTPKYAKRGAHMIFPNIKINAQMARNIRAFVIDKLKYALIDEKNYNNNLDWDTIIDDAVYNEGRSSLRMIYSYKITKCGCGSSCYNCDEHYGNIKDYANMYKPLCVFDQNGKIISAKTLLESKYFMLCSIQHFGPPSMIFDPNELPKIYINSQKRKRNKRDDKTTLVGDRKIKDAIEHIVRDMGYNGLKVHKITQNKKYKGVTYFYINVVSMHNEVHICKIKNGEHSKSSIYFEIKCQHNSKKKTIASTTTTITQKCYSDHCKKKDANLRKISTQFLALLLADNITVDTYCTPQSQNESLEDKLNKFILNCKCTIRNMHGHFSTYFNNDKY